jgi:hypothetical protein
VTTIEHGRNGPQAVQAPVRIAGTHLILACRSPRQPSWWAYEVVAVTMVMLFWWASGKIFKNVGLVVE